MKYVYRITLIPAAIVLLGCATSIQTPQQEHASTQTTYEVFGMDCPGCHGGLEKNLKKIPGVVTASANWKKKMVTITVESGREIDSAAIRKAIKDSNFTVGKVVSSP